VAAPAVVAVMAVMMMAMMVPAAAMTLLAVAPL
jgi:hypothetical protein